MKIVSFVIWFFRIKNLKNWYVTGMYFWSRGSWISKVGLGEKKLPNSYAIRELLKNQFDFDLTE